MKKNSEDILAICNRTISSNEEVVSLIKKKFKYCKLNLTGKTLNRSKLQKFLKQATLAIVGLEVIDKKLLDNLPKLQKIAKYGVGLDNIDVLSIKDKKIKFFYSKSFNKRSVAEFSLCLIIFLLRNIKKGNDNFVKNLTWLNLNGQEVTNKKIGIIGCGNIGKEIVKIIKIFKCKIFSYDIKNYKSFNERHKIKRKSLNYIFKTSDIISLNLPLNKKTENLIKYKYLKKMKKNSLLINTSRGGIVNEKDLFNFLSKNKSIFYGTDVLANEPPTNKKKLYKLKNFFATPHMAGTTQQSILRGAKLCLQFLCKK